MAQQQSETRSTSFVCRRWSADIRGYVDTSGQPVKSAKLHQKKKSPWKAHLPAMIPKQGQFLTFLTLPTEIRLQIYSHIIGHDSPAAAIRRMAVGLPPMPAAPYAYLYRSPGRAVRPNPIDNETLKLLHICRQIRNERLDIFSRERTYILECSLYREPVAGLLVLPTELGPTVWVTHLLLMTAIQVDGKLRGLADLRPLQAMTNLKELRIIFVACKGTKQKYELRIDDLVDNPIKAILKCVPPTTHVTIGVDTPAERDDLAQLGASVNYLLDVYDLDFQRKARAQMCNMLKVMKTKGVLSGSTYDHLQCKDQSCGEALNCASSRPLSLVNHLEVDHQEVVETPSVLSWITSWFY